MAFNPLEAFKQQLQNVVGTIGGTIGDLLNGLGQTFVNEVIQPVFAIVHNELEKVGGGFSNIGDDIHATLEHIVSAVGSDFAQLQASLHNQLQGDISDIGQGFNVLGQGVHNDLEAVERGVGNDFSALGADLHEILKTIFGDVEGKIVDIKEAIIQTVRPALEEVGGFIQQLPRDIGLIAQGVQNELGAVKDELGRIADNALSRVPIWSQLGQHKDAAIGDIERLLEFGKNELGSILGSVYKSVLPYGNYITLQDIEKMVGSLSAETVLGASEAKVESVAFITAGLLNRIFESFLQTTYRNIEYTANSSDPNKEADIDTLIRLLFRKQISAEEFRTLMAKQGFGGDASYQLTQAALRLNDISTLADLFHRGVIATETEYLERAEKLGFEREEATKYFEATRVLLGEGQAIEFWRRGILPKGWSDPFDDLRKAGVTDERIDAIKHASYMLPSIFNLQDFAVRGVDDPATVEKYKLDFGINEAFFEGARKAGFDRETALRFYRQYWQYPPFFIAVSEYKSGAIDKQTFADIMHFERYTPFWIETLSKQLAPKLTIADIKDLYKYQVITADEIPAKLATINVPEELALQYKALWISTIKLASPLEGSDIKAKTQKIKDVNESMIIRGYRDGILNENAALSQLKNLEYTDAAAHLLIAEQNYSKEQENIKARFTLIKDDLLAGNTDLNQALQNIQALGLTTIQYDTFADELIRATTHKPVIPSIAEGKSWVKKGIMTIDQFTQLIALHGYSPFWAQFYLAEIPKV